MKKRAFLKCVALTLAAITIFNSVIIAGTAAGLCIHSTNKQLIATDTGYTVVNACTLCGETISDTGYIDDSETLTLYKDKEKTTTYTADELETGFATVTKETELYVDNGVISNSGKDPYWFTFDMNVNALPNINEGSTEGTLINTNSRAYKGWALISMVLNGSYLAPLRFMADGWELESGAEGTTKGEADGYSEIKFYGSSNSYRNMPTAAKIAAGDTVNFALRVNPVNGDYDVYLNNKFVGSGNMTAKSDGSNPYIRLWEDNGTNLGGKIGITNIKFFKENYTAAIHTHLYSPIIDFDDEGFSIYNVCNCGNRIVLPSEKITSLATDGLPHIYDGLGSFSVNSNLYWFVTDINIRHQVKNGALLTFGEDTILEIKDGNISSNGSVITAVTFPITYQVAVKVFNGAYELYINGRPATSGNIDNTTNITCGDEAFGHHVRFLYNKAVLLSEEGVAKIPSYTSDAEIKLCNHSDSNISAIHRIVKKGADGNMKYIYNCTKCGERVYSRLTGDLTNPNNDIVYKNKPSRLLRSELRSFTTDTTRILYLENNVISASAPAYWISFSVTPNSISSPDTGDAGDPNTVIYRGYNMLSVDPSFYPASQLTIIPDGWEKESGANAKTKGTADGIAEVKVLQYSHLTNIGTNNVESRNTTTIAYLEVGKTTDFALRIDPTTGVYDVYVDGEYKATAKKLPTADHFPQIKFHDIDAGNYTYSNVKIAAEERNYSDTVTTMEITAKYTPNTAANTKSYLPVVYIKRIGDNGTKQLDLLYVQERNGKLAVKTSDGMKYLYSKEGEILTVKPTNTEIAIVYDDIKDNVRYYVDGKVGYIDGKIAINVPVYDDEFAALNAKADIIRADYSIVTDINTYAVHPSGLPSIVGFQTHESTGEIRILAGLDMHWYGSVGYTVECYDRDGVLVGTESLENDLVYEKVVAEGKEVYATYYGFKYFSPLKVSDVNYYKYKGYSLIVTPFTKIGSVKYTGEAKKIIVTETGYEYDNDYVAK